LPHGYTLYAFILSPTNTLYESTWDVINDFPVNFKVGFSQAPAFNFMYNLRSI